MLAATDAGAEELVAELLGGLRQLRGRSDGHCPDRPRHTLSAELAGEIDPAAGQAEESS
jgi:hypothetical protein